MKIFKRTPKPPIDELLKRYFTDELTEKEHNRLDRWVRKSESNMHTFEQLADNDFQPRSVKKINQSGTPHERMANKIAHLLAGYMRKNLNEDQQCELDEWIGANPKNKKLFEELTDPRRVELALELLNSPKP